MAGNIEKARVPPDSEQDSPTLFPLGQFAAPLPSPEAVCRRLGLNWMSALELSELGWLSFDPKATPRLSRCQEAELTFLGSLVAAGCDASLLRHLLARLRKPYAYRLDLIHYDWAAHTWRLLEDAEDLESQFEEWMSELVGWQELERLERLRDRIDGAIGYLRGRRSRPPGAA
jgi:hypothetical protein